MTMRLVVTLTDPAAAPAEWARAREAEGWQGLAVSDHIVVGNRALPHVWVTAAELALATDAVSIATSFANNLLRSPVEFAQAALTLQRASGGRFEAGLGAGWDQAELEATGVRFPAEAGERAGRYIEACQIVRALFTTGQAVFAGEWYQVEVATIGPVVERPPPLVVSVGGPRTTAALAPLADVVEVKLPGFATTGKGPLHTRTLRDVTLADVRERLQRVREVQPDVTLALFVSVGCSPDPVVAAIHDALGDSPWAALFGEPAEVAAAIATLGDLGIGRLTLGGVTTATYEQLAPELEAAGLLASVR